MSNQVRFQTRPQRWIHSATVFAGALLACGLCLTGAEPDAKDKDKGKDEKSEKKSSDEPVNSIGIAIGGTLVDGPRSQYQRRYDGVGDRAFGGVDSLHYEKEVAKDWLFKLDGRAILENYDYSVKLDLSNEQVGYLRAGYRQFRTWSDGVGGFDPRTSAWYPLSDQVLHLDRGNAWVEAGLTLPNWPVMKLRYEHDFREGLKDSTIWGQAAGAAVPGGRLGIVPSLWDIDEQRDTFQGDVSHHFGETALGLGLRYQVDNMKNTLSTYQLYKSGTVTQRESQKTQAFNAHAFTETKFNDKLTLTTGYSYTTLDSDLAGSRVFDATLPTAPLAGFLGLNGGSAVRQYIFTLNLLVQPWENLSIVPSIRAQKEDTGGTTFFTSTPAGTALSAQDENDFVEVAERLEIRYTGLTNWVFYTRGDWMQDDGNEVEQQLALATGAQQLLTGTDYTRLTQQYTAGVNWYPLSKLNFSGQYYHKVRNNDYNHVTRVSTVPGFYPAFLDGQDYETDDLNARVTWRPLAALSFVSRYDYQVSTIDTTATGLTTVESGNLKAHILSETVTWSPLNWLYVQGGINYALNTLSTPGSDLNPLVVQASDNDYWTATFSAGMALDAKTDLRAQYLYSRADNYSINSSVSQPYGAGFEEHGVTVTLARMLTQSLRWTLQYGYTSFRDQATQDRTEFRAHLIYSGLLYRF